MGNAQGVGNGALKGAAVKFMKAEFAAGRGKKPTPRELEALMNRVIGARDVHESINLIRSRGGRVIYEACDASDANAMRACFAPPATGLSSAALVRFDLRARKQRRTYARASAKTTALTSAAPIITSVIESSSTSPNEPHSRHLDSLLE